MNTTVSPDIAGRIHVKLGVADAQVTSVDIDSTRPQGVTKIFAGRSPHETVRVLGMIFSLCSTAQSIAALCAAEDALGQQPDKAEQAARDVLREAEMLTQTIMRVSIDWPRALGLDLGIEMTKAAMACQTELERELFGGGNWKHVGGVGLTPDVSAVGDLLLGLQGVLKTALYDECFATGLLAALDRLGLNGFGALVDGGEPETGALMRHWQAPDVVAAREQYGAGLRARLVSRLVDIQNLPKSMMARLDQIGTCAPSNHTPTANGVGEATVETARGALHHKVEIADNKVVVYDISAPTDVNFEPGGVVSTGLLGADGQDFDALHRAAKLHVLAVDPCVSCELEILMHEMSLAEGVLQIMEDQAKAQNFKRVKTVWLEIGELSHVDPEAIAFCFDAVIRGSIADGARLEIVRVPGQAWCHDCSKQIEVKSLVDPCPLCGGDKVMVTGGDDMRVKEIEVEDE